MIRSAAGKGNLSVRMHRAHNVCMLAIWHRIVQIDIQPGLDQPMFDRQLERCLFQDFAPVCQHEHALAGSPLAR